VIITAATASSASQNPIRWAVAIFFTGLISVSTVREAKRITRAKVLRKEKWDEIRQRVTVRTEEGERRKPCVDDYCEAPAGIDWMRCAFSAK
jgi:hypothetical protein